MVSMQTFIIHNLVYKKIPLRKLFWSNITPSFQSGIFYYSKSDKFIGANSLFGNFNAFVPSSKKMVLCQIPIGHKW